MVLADSNILIYATQPEHARLRFNVAVHPAEGRRGAPLPRIGCNGLLDCLD